MTNPSTDNECTLRGWTEAVIETGFHSLHVSYSPDAEIDDAFMAFCHDDQEMIRVNGWLIESLELI